jgi:hypothetical protein
MSSSRTSIANLRTPSIRAVLGDGSSPRIAAGHKLLGLLGQVQSGDGVLAHGLLILRIEVGVLVLDDLAHADLGQFLGHQLFIEQAALDGGLVLHKGGDDLVQVLLADARGFLALGFGQSLDLDLELPGLRLTPTLHLRRVVAARRSRSRAWAAGPGSWA